MQNYIDFANKNDIILLAEGACQFCGAQTTRGVHECVEIFNLGFQKIDYSKTENHIYRFISVDAHTLQHPELHGRWNNHFHLSRQHLIFEYEVKWSYQLSTKLSDFLNQYKKNREKEILLPPKALSRGQITTTDVLNNSRSENDCQKMIVKWGKEVYGSWKEHFRSIDKIAIGFLDSL